MNEKIMEFWGQMLLQAAQGKKQTDQFMKWMNKGVADPDFIRSPEMESFFSPFLKFYGLDQSAMKSAGNEDYLNVCQKAMTDFQNSFQDALSLIGVIPRKDHLELVKKYEALKEKCADQEETIKHLKMLLNDKKTESVSDTDFFREMLNQQGELFQKTVQDFGRHFAPPKKDSDSKDEKKRGDGADEQPNEVRTDAERDH